MLEYERHYTFRELAKLWGFSYSAIRELFSMEPGVLRLHNFGESVGKRSYQTCRVPQSVADRVYARLRQDTGKAHLPRKNPRRVVYLRDRNRRVA